MSYWIPNQKQIRQMDKHAEEMAKKLKVGDTVVYSSSPTYAGRTSAYMGKVQKIEGIVVFVETMGYGPGCCSAIRANYCRLARHGETPQSVHAEGF